MNQDQAVSLITKLIVAVCSALAVKYGISSDELQNVAVDAATLGVGIATIWYSHNYNKTTPPTTPPTT